MALMPVGECDAARELRPLEGVLVEVNGVEGLYEPDTHLYGHGVEPFEVNGERGRVVGWDEEIGTYVVQTFSGHVLSLPEDKLIEYDPADPRDGGFDVAWPHGPTSFGIFSSIVSENIKTKGVCVIQMMLGDQGVENAVEYAKTMRYGALRDDVEEEYLGNGAETSKVCWLQYEPPDEHGAETTGMRAYDVEEFGSDMTLDHLDGLAYCDKALTVIAASMWPLTPEFEGDKAFVSWGRTNPLVRANVEPGEEHHVRSTPVDVDPGNGMETHTQFVASKRLCLLYVVNSGGGELELTPKSEAYDFEETVIPLSKNQLVIFRCDYQGFYFSYKPLGENLALQSWVLDVPHDIREKEEQLRVIDGPEEPMGERSNVMSVMTRYPGCGHDPLAYWNMFFTSTDTQVEVPIVRWDIDIYYRAEHTIGYSHQKHGGMLQQAELENFDNAFFGLSDAEANIMAPYQRCLLEVGYECLTRAEYKREDLRGFECGVFVGDSGSDWEELARPTDLLQNYKAGRERSVASSRLSFIMGMVGPTFTAETACSSSLVALGMCQQAMRLQLAEKGQATPHIDTRVQHGLVLGTNTIIGTKSYIGLSGPGMLSPQGRCFTFDNTADGYARGEGIGGIKMKMCDSSLSAAGRMCVVVGACVNQDGKSASMTAPHGPSQQEVIRASMREGGLDTSGITIAECHGTGTALGDPIEVGALRGIFNASRHTPLLFTSAKTCLGHLEAGAGAAGFIKCCLMLQFSVGIPNNHCRSLNPHLDVEGFPAYFESEAVDFEQNSGLTGVSSFGFGGTNARADVWGNCQQAHRYSVAGTVTKRREMIF